MNTGRIEKKILLRATRACVASIERFQRVWHLVWHEV